MNDASSQRSMESYQYSLLQLLSLIALRLLIGWHFLYEGFAKVFNANWTAAGYLLESKGIFSGIFKFMAESSAILEFVDWSNKIGLIGIGIGMMTGTLTRTACACGIVLIMMYYFATPPFIGYTYSVPVEGSYMIVNKNLVEAGALLVLILFPTAHIAGLDRLIFPRKSI
ncbi:DoxX subfamily [Candidatus Latescibacterota bacterium]